jgi:hypothetical protein
MPSRRTEHAAEVRRALSDPLVVAELLGLERSREERRKWACPSCKKPNLSLTKGRDRTLRVNCFSCELAGDLFTLLAQALGLDVRSDFAALLVRGAELAGRWDILAELDGTRAPQVPQVPQVPLVVRPKALGAEGPLPSLDDETFGELARVILAACPLNGSPDVSSYLAERGLYLLAMEAGWGALPQDQGPLLAELRAVFGVDVLERSGLVMPVAERFTWAGHRVLVPWYAPGDPWSIATIRRRVLAGRDDGPRYVAPRGRSAKVPYMCRWDIEHAEQAKVIVYVEGETDALAFRWLWRWKWNETDPILVLGLGGVTALREVRASYAEGRRAIVAFDADRAGAAAVEALRAELERVGATKVTKASPKAGKDWADMMREVTHGIR